MCESPGYLTDQLITYLGNKRALIGPVVEAVESVKIKLNKSHLKILDAFAGSGVVSRAFKPHAELLISNDLEPYAAAIGRCFLTNKSTVNFQELATYVDAWNSWAELGRIEGFITELYAPSSPDIIKAEDSVYYTYDNAQRLDTFRALIDAVPHEYKDLLLGPLLSKASIHANTAGHFRSFFKDKHTKIGKFGGSRELALARILKPITLELPVLSNYECEVEVHQRDSNALVRELSDLDLVYIDPPYTDHGYGAFYFMLNLITEYERPTKVTKKTRTPTNWRRSDYNSRLKTHAAFEDLLKNIDSKFILVSYNNTGHIPLEEMRSLLQAVGKVTEQEIPHKAYHSSRTKHLPVTEHLFLVET